MEAICQMLARRSCLQILALPELLLQERDLLLQERDLLLQERDLLPLSPALGARLVDARLPRQPIDAAQRLFPKHFASTGP